MLSNSRQACLGENAVADLRGTSGTLIHKRWSRVRQVEFLQNARPTKCQHLVAARSLVSNAILPMRLSTQHQRVRAANLTVLPHKPRLEGEQVLPITLSGPLN
jgi:hypothetical protein